MMYASDGQRTPGIKLLLAILIGVALGDPALLGLAPGLRPPDPVGARRRRRSPQGWGGPQAMAGPVLVIPYRATATETVVENGQSVTRSRDVMRELTLAPEAVELSTDVEPERAQALDLRSGGL